MTQITDDYIFRLWEQGSSAEDERKLKKILAADIDVRAQKMCEVTNRLKKLPALDGPVFRWEEQWAYPTFISGQYTDGGGGTTGTFRVNSGVKLFGQTISAALIKQVIREKTILERESDGVQMYCSDISDVTGASPWDIVTIQHGDSTLTSDSGNVSWRIISEKWSDFKDVDHARGLDLIFREVGSQIFAEAMEFPETLMNTKYENRFNTFTYQKELLEEKLARQLAYSLLRGRPEYQSNAPVYGNKTQESQMCGLCQWPIITQAESSNTNVYQNKAGAALVKTDIDNLVRNLMLEEYADFGNGDWIVLCHPITHEYIHDFQISYRRTDEKSKGAGFYVDEIHTKIGKTFPVISTQYMRQSALLVVNLSKAGYGYYAGDTMHRKDIPTQGRYERWLMSFQTYGVVLRDPRANVAMIYGLPMT